MAYTCTEAVLAEIAALVGGDVDVATSICTDFDCSNGAAECVIKYLSAKTVELADGSAPASTQLGLDVMFLLFSAYLVFMMQLGFCLLTAGSIRSKNCMNILMKNVLDVCVGTIGYYTLGYAFAYGHPVDEFSNRFIGNYNFALTYTSGASRLVDGETNPAFSFDPFAYTGWHSFVFQWSFAAATTTIVSGAVAERCNFWAYLGYCLFLSSFVYPVVSHWVWSSSGWLSMFNIAEADGRGPIPGLKIGAIDFAGSGVVHMTGGCAALMGAWIVGPRIGRFDSSGRVNEMKGHSATLVVMGTFLLWFGWYGFNPGSNLVISSVGAAVTVSRAATTTTLSAAGAGITLLAYKYIRFRYWDTLAVSNACLAGLVAITAGCSVVEPWAAIIAGATGAMIFNFGEWFILHKCKIDDPVSAIAVHMFAGAWGVIFVGLMAKPQFVSEVYGGYAIGSDPIGDKLYGAFYGGNGKLLAAQVIEVCVIFAWTCGCMGAYFLIAKLGRFLRVPPEQELAGLDVSKHGGSAYNGDDGETAATVNRSVTKVAPSPY